MATNVVFTYRWMWYPPAGEYQLVSTSYGPIKRPDFAWMWIISNTFGHKNKCSIWFVAYAKILLTIVLSFLSSSLFYFQAIIYLLWFYHLHELIPINYLLYLMWWKLLSLMVQANIVIFTTQWFSANFLHRYSNILNLWNSSSVVDKGICNVLVIVPVLNIVT